MGGGHDEGHEGAPHQAPAALCCPPVVSPQYCLNSGFELKPLFCSLMKNKCKFVISDSAGV